MHNTIQFKHTNFIPTNIDHIPSNATHSGPSAMLYVFVDNEAVIKMMMKGRRHQFADMLIKGNFTRCEWNNRLHLLNTSQFSSTCCTKNFSLRSCSTMAKRIQKQKEKERVVSESRPAAMNLSSFIATSSSTASSPIASTSPGMPMGVVVRGFPSLCGSSRRSDSWWRNLSTEGAWRCAGCT